METNPRSTEVYTIFENRVLLQSYASSQASSEVRPTYPTTGATPQSIHLMGDTSLTMNTIEDVEITSSQNLPEGAAARANLLQYLITVKSNE